jgi:hypothetical protein
MTPHRLHTRVILLTVLLVAALAATAAAQSPTAAPGPSSTVAGDRDVTKTELHNFDRYLDEHPGIARELRNDPNLINNPSWLAQHPDTQKFLHDHPGVNDEFRENPNQFMSRENRYERNGGDISRHEAAMADDFLDRHPKVASDLQRNPKLIDDPQYLAQHPKLQSYLQNHPEVRQDWKQHPYAFENRERQYERNENRKPKPTPTPQ